MRTIKILGTGCPNCKRTESIIEAVVTQLNLDFKIEKIEDIQEIMKYNVMSTPAVVLDDEVIIKGRVPSLIEIKDVLTAVTCCSSTENSCCGGEHHEHRENSNSNTQAKKDSCCSN